MAAASVVTAAGMATITYELYQNHPSFSLGTLDFHYGLRLAGDVAGTLGFLLAAIAGILARTIKAPESAPTAASAFTSAVTATPLNSVAPAITGTATSGQTLSASPGSRRCGG